MGMYNEIEIDKMDAYFRNELNDLERAEVEAKVQKSEEFASLFWEMKSLYRMKEKLRRMAVIREIGKKFSSSDKSSYLSSLTLLGAED